MARREWRPLSERDDGIAEAIVVGLKGAFKKAVGADASREDTRGWELYDRYIRDDDDDAA